MEFSKKTIPQDFIEIKSKYNLIQTTPELLANATQEWYRKFAAFASLPINGNTNHRD
jgi:hypothetical protein